MHTQIQAEATKFSYDSCYMRTEHTHKYDYVDIWLHQHEYDYSSLGRTGSTSTLPCAASTRLPAAAALHRLRRTPRRRLLGVRLPRLLTSTSLNQKTSQGRLPRHQQLVGPPPTRQLQLQPSRLHHRPPRFHRHLSTNQAKSLISIIIFSLACSPHTGTNTKDYFVYASQRLPASRATLCQLFLGDR
jgi:hypothetical protein